MTIALTQEQMRWLEAEVAAGRFVSVEDGVRIAVAELMEALSDEAVTTTDIEADDMAWAKPLVDEASAEFERGEGIPWEEARRHFDAHLKKIGAR